LPTSTSCTIVQREPFAICSIGVPVQSPARDGARPTTRVTWSWGMHDTSSFSIRELERAVTSYDIARLYEILDYDYAAASQNAARVDDDVLARRDRFLRQLCLLRTPTDEEIRRFFNQLNAAYADKLIWANTAALPGDFLTTANQLMLYRQGKRLGLRDRAIAFGARLDLDVLDPLRAYKVLTGVAPPFLPNTLAEWANAVDVSDKRQEAAIALAMCLIAIHPFTDGNGRVGRLVFTWLCARWGIQTEWLSEGSDGELLRTGVGVHSTEHLMTRLMSRAAEGHNRAFPYGDFDSAATAAAALRRTMRNLPALMESAEFILLREHLSCYDHIRPVSPRFQSLETFMRA
jgi:hypothetical protein